MRVTVAGSGDAFGSGERFQTCIALGDPETGAPAYALRVEDAGSGDTVAYSGDTEWTDALIDTSAGADVFLCEGL